MSVYSKITGGSKPSAPSGSLLHGLVEDREKDFVGYVFRCDYEEALVLTNDRWKFEAGGVPLNSILVATAMNLADPSKTPPLAEEAIILRVLGPADLPSDREMIKAHVERFQKKISGEIEDDGTKTPPPDRDLVDERDGVDRFTHAQMQFGGLRCRILGTMYLKDGRLKMGADNENFFSVSHLRVYKAKGDGLSAIVNYVDPAKEAKAAEDAEKMGFGKLPDRVVIGTVRYTSTDRLQTGGKNPEVEIRIHPFDLLARRTGVFGMTRTGKSNTTKTMVSAIALAAIKSGQKIGQLIFDVNGEYANANHQDDGSSIADVFGTDAVVRYRGMDTPGFEDLRLNFYESLDIGLSMLQNLLQAESNAASQEFKTFLSMNFDEPDPGDWSAKKRWNVKVAIYRSLLSRAQFKPPSGFKVKFTCSKDVVEKVGAAIDPTGTPASWIALAGGTATKTGITCSMTPDDAADWFEVARSVKDDLKSGSSKKPWFDDDAVVLLDLLVNKSSARSDSSIIGVKAFRQQNKYHSPKGSENVANDIYKLLQQGKIVILDLSVGTELVRKVMAERIARQVFERSMSLFHENEPPPNIVLYVEEAHNLIGAKAEPDETWPRIAKEGAKARVGLIYATQEPSSVQPNILKNTENIFVTHLNGDDEVKTICKFYDFSDFAKSIKKAQDPGFARIKTLSSNFVLPVQIKKFEPAAIIAEVKAHTGKSTPAKAAPAHAGAVDSALGDLKSAFDMD